MALFNSGVNEILSSLTFDIILPVFVLIKFVHKVESIVKFEY